MFSSLIWSLNAKCKCIVCCQSDLTVHKLRPADIKVVAALGDSVTVSVNDPTSFIVKDKQDVPHSAPSISLSI